MSEPASVHSHSYPELAEIVSDDLQQELVDVMAVIDRRVQLTNEYPITAEAFITLAASVGLFNDDSPKRFPRSSAPCRISIHTLAKRDYIVRHATSGDLERLCRLEELCWHHTRTPREQIRARLENYPEGQFVLEKDGQVLGAAYSQRIVSIDPLMTSTAADVHKLHDRSGTIIQLLAVNIDPAVQDLGYGDQLLELMLQRCSLMTGVERVVGVTLCKGFDPAGAHSFEDYIRLQGSDQDAVLAFHLSHGAEVVDVVPGYRPEDHTNLHNGVLVAYEILNRAQRSQRLEAEEDAAEHTAPSAAAGLQEIGDFVAGEAARLLGIGSELDRDRPVMEMGLDSADLLKLQRLCEARFGLRLEAGFFFEHGTIRKVIDCLAVRLAAAPADADRTNAAQLPLSAVRDDRVAPDEISPTDIAVVGMACKLPGGIETPDQFWRVLSGGECVVGTFPATRGPWPAGVDHPGVERGGFVEDADAFDAAFFRMSPAEAQVTDPQQRILLELVWKCLEDAGILPEALKGTKTGVFVGASNGDYSRLVQEAGVEIEAHHGVGSSLALIANRVSYFLDLCGPSLVIDTACSASLVALHEAVQSLRGGECAAAFVGGVNLICHPDLSIAYQKAGMLAPDGRCKVFDAHADGYVRSEGAVVLLLKPLRAAVAERNQIHAVIRGSAVNHGGLAGGLTVPNPQKQSELLISAWKDAGISAHDLSCIEAHGTGTPLGDPIELQGIQSAYAQYGDAALARACAIGSVKSNLGHLEPAAGITGLLKIILSFRHRQIPASINLTRLNPRIRLADTPFFIPDRLWEWDSDQPRLASVSSFGSGGTNAHVVVQEYSSDPVDSCAEDAYLFVLSAATQDRLRAYVTQVIDWLERQPTGASLGDAIYTWQVGRTAMRQRLAIKAKDREDLRSKLNAWLAGNGDVPDVWSGQALQKDSSVHRAWQTKSGRQLIEHALSERDIEPLAALWTSGTDLDWRNYDEGPGWSGRKPSIVSLPTYPFARERYWIETAASRRGATGPAKVALHPLLHANSSDLTRQSYSSTFSGEEFFLSDHRVRSNGGAARKILPGAACLEMARAAIQLAQPTSPELSTIELRDTVWLQPVVVDGEKSISISLTANDDEQIDYEICSQDADERIVHCKGRAVFGARTAQARVDLERIERQIGGEKMEPSRVYAACERIGLVYGPAFQGIVAIEEGASQSLARLRLPAVVEETADDYVLHPSVVDGALQAAVLFVQNGNEPSGQPRLPFALDSLRVLSPCSRDMVAWVRYTADGHAGNGAAKLDIDLCDESGNACAELRGLSLRTLSKEIAIAGAENEAAVSLLARPIWETTGGEVPGRAGGIEHAEHHVVLCELPAVDAGKLESLVPNSRCLSLHEEPGETVAKRYSDHALACFERIQSILRSRPQGSVLVQIIIADHEEHAVLAGLSGLLRTAALENPQLAGQIILVPPQVTAEELAELVREEKTRQADHVIRYGDGTRRVLRWREIPAEGNEPSIELKERGVYLITGGLGGLGILFARELLARTEDARVILTGRSVLSAEGQALLDEVPSGTGRLSYRQVDLCDADQVARLIGEVRSEHGQLDGILHCAGMIADAFILKKDALEFAEVLAPKVLGTYNLDQGSRDVDLDFFVLFSSFAGAIGNVGQADYAAANGFMDQFAAYRNSLVTAKRRHGRTRAIDWPSWQAGGMTMDPASQELLRQATGLMPMPSATGILAFHRALALPYDQVLVLVGDLSRIRRTVIGDRALPAALQAERVVVEEIDSESLSEKTQDYLRRELAGVLKLSTDKIDPRAPLEEYGIDSMLAMKLTSQLETTFGPLSKTLFFEYKTIAELAEYFVGRHSVQLTERFAGMASGGGQAVRPAVPASAAPAKKAVATRRFNRPRDGAGGLAGEAIAMIGLSGRYPEAVDLDAYWDNLRDGKDCIIEVPIERWNWREYFSEDRSDAGRHYSKWGGFIAGVDEFDPQFFNISPREAKYIDPQERLFLQHAWMALEDAGYTRAALQAPAGDDLSGQVGVYVGVMWSEYQLLGVEADSRELRMGFAGNLASIANRVSYAMNLHGPSMTLDSMCSSSLTAIHIACQDLKLGRTDTAIAGGVNVSVHPNKYLMLSLGQFISGDGHCQSFGEGGDGYIPGEGVGVVVLKRLVDAERDGDHVYGVIRGSALTHGGKTNGYTVPNPQAQSSAISRALAGAGVDARHVSYVEAHGTGTKLGDPIEIAALERAFRRDTQDAGFCLIGSAKSNVGHCEAAAGMAGLTKVLLQMQHRQIVPSLHSAQLNPNIDFTGSPFVVNQSLRPWEQPVIDGRKVKRVAGLSSFGAGGSNAHMIVEEHETPVQEPIPFANAAILLSARTAEQLEQKVRELLTFVAARQSSLDLLSLAYTLQVGREAMEERLGFVVSSVEQLLARLEAYLAGEQEIEDAYRGQAKRGREALSLFSTDSDLRHTVDTWIADGKLSRLLDLWVKGLEPDWSKLYGQARPRRMSLPTYPFARERHWIEASGKRRAAIGPGQAALHPLLHSNTSDLSEQRFRSTFAGDELFIAEYGGQKVLPAAASLEMARAAIELALHIPPESGQLELRNTVWSQPIVVSESRPISIALITEQSEGIGYEIYSEDDGREVVHCQGSAVVSREPAPARLDLEQLEVQGQRLVRLRASQPGDYVLHPTLMADALRTAVASSDGSPSELGLLRIVSACTPEMVAWVRRSSDGQAADGAVRLDIDLCDEHGNVAVQMRDLVWRQALQPGAAPWSEGPASPAAPVPMPKEIAFLKMSEAPSAPVERKKRSAIALAVPGTSVPSPASSPGRARVALSIASPGEIERGKAIASHSPVTLYDRGNGVFSIEIAASRSQDVISHVLQALDHAQQSDSLKVLMLSGIEYCFLGGGRDGYNEALERKLFRRLVSFAYPIVALLSCDAIGAGFLATSLCDFMVCNQDAQYGYTEPERGYCPTPAETMLFSERFGEARANDFVCGTSFATGRQLRARGWTCPFVPWEQVEAYGQQLASDLATKSRDALRLLKEHMSRRLVELVDALRPVNALEMAIEERSSADQVLVVKYGEHTVKELAAARTASSRAIVLVIEDPDLREDAVWDLQRVLFESEIPVVCALTGNAGGNAWLAGQFCDAAVYCDTGVYSAATIGQGLASTAVAVFSHRFGSEAAGEILLTGTDYSGVDLQQRLGAARVVEHDRVLPTAVRIAESWTRMPRAALAAWTQQTATTLRDKVASVPSVAGWEQQKGDVHLAAPGPIALQSRVVTATVYPEGIVLVKMEDRGAKNMFSEALLDGIREVFAHIEQVRAYKVVILTGFDSYFASGGTKETLLAIQEGKIKFTDLAVFQVALDCSLPVIAAMQGHGIGAGWSMGLFADIVILSNESRYVSPYMNYGFTPGAGATYNLAEKLGVDLARESLFTARHYAGSELKERGLKLRVVPRADVDATAMTLAGRISRFSRDRVIGLKRLLTANVSQTLEETYRRELAMHEETFVGRPDTRARIQTNLYEAIERSETELPKARIPRSQPARSSETLSDITATLKTLLANELQMPESDLDEGAQFVDLGLDSITGVTWIRKINQKYQTSIEATKVYGYPTLTQLSQYVWEEAVRRGTPLGESASPADDLAPSPAKSTPPAENVSARPTSARLESRRGGKASRFISGGAALRPLQPIAVVGMAGQFPGAANLEEFWENIAQGRNCITEVPRNRWDVDSYYEPGDAVAGKTNSRWAGVVEGYDQFDPLFFNISPTEAESMDPQQRLFLQACWHGIEDAGYDAQALSGSKCGVFVGCTAGDYHQASPEHQWSAHGFTGRETSILAGRISYFLNLQGPSVSVNTACSSALVAVAQACDSLISGASDLALAGGVYVMTGPGMHIKTSQAGMLSPEGKCFTFDQRADGFVPGEGVGVVLLKRLADAERDRDIIHGVIEGWGVNQDGKTNGITAPNPESQTRLEQDVYERFQIDPANIQLIEAHGTGTKLGDPIEVDGLRQAFRKYTAKKDYCALGSVKSNIGHCLSAAGIAGFLKTTLALKRKQLPPTINFEQLNEHIDLSDSPFYINSRLRDWSLNGGGRRQAAISSFGFSGTNAHMVIAESPPSARSQRLDSTSSPNTETIIPLSAKTPQQLKQKAVDLLGFIRQYGSSTNLMDLAYTLQIGRTAMDERLGFVVSSMEQLVEGLQVYVDGERLVGDADRGRVTRSKESMSIINLDDETKGMIVARWIASRKLSQVLKLWVNGGAPDWNDLYGQVKPQRISLPTYPFAKERYWIDGPGHENVLAKGTLLHPLLHRSSSDLSVQRYETTFTGGESFLADHRVRLDGKDAQRMLPGVTYLEMARAAIEQAWPAQRKSSVLELRDNVWLRPLVVEGQEEVSIALFAVACEQVDYEISSAKGGESRVLCQGQAVFVRQPATAGIDVERLRQEMGRGRWEAAEVYAIFDAMGLHYGPAHRGITAIHLGNRQLLAELRLPDVVDASQADYVLHPSLMDGALQASIGLIVDRDHIPGRPVVPFAVESVRIIAACRREMVAWVRHAEASGPGDVKLDIDLCDQEGAVCVLVRGLALRFATEEAKAAGQGIADERLLTEEDSSFDGAFYERVLADILNGDVSVDEAATLG